MIKIEIPILPKTSNSLSRCHWRTRSQHANAIKKAVMIYLRQANAIPEVPYEKAKLTLTRHSSMAPDFDGLVSSFKWVIDGIVRAGVIENDDFIAIGQPSYKYEKVKRGDGKITIEIEPLD